VTAKSFRSELHHLSTTVKKLVGKWSSTFEYLDLVLNLIFSEPSSFSIEDLKALPYTMQELKDAIKPCADPTLMGPGSIDFAEKCDVIGSRVAAADMEPSICFAKSSCTVVQPIKEERATRMDWSTESSEDSHDSVQPCTPTIKILRSPAPPSTPVPPEIKSIQKHSKPF
jgi:hypothetical protein